METLEEKIKRLENELAEVKKQLKEKESCKKWEPKLGEEYWYIDGYGECSKTTHDEMGIDLYRIYNGNCFKTEEEATEYKNKLDCQAKFRNYIEKHSKKLDWNNDDQEKWFIYYSYLFEKIDFDTEYICKCQGVIYASSQKILKKAIKELGEENIKKYILEVE